MPEPIYHVTALYCGEPRLLFAGYASRVTKKLRLIRTSIPTGEFTGYVFGPSRDKWGNALPYTLWSGPITIAEYVPTKVEYEGEAA